jgi:nucleotide-binding universal stress UspA family protein
MAMIRNVLVQLGEDERRRVRARAAFAVARRFEGRALGLFPLVRPQTPNFAEINLADLTAREWGRRQEAAREEQKAFLAEATAAGVPAQAAAEEGLPEELLTDWGRTADLLVLSQPTDDEDERPAEALVLGLGRPVLMVPYAGEFPTVGDTVAVAWNGTREAARALHAAMPFLLRARKIFLVGVDLDGRPKASIERLAQNLAAHALDVRLERIPSGGLAIGDILLNAAADLAADLLVMGAYGHSRTRELVFGGATRSLFRHMTLPTLFAH